MDELDFQYICGTIRAVLFYNEENGYAVIKLDNSGEAEEKGLITLTGCVPGAACGEELSAEGSWVEHPEYGKQFKAETVERRMPSTQEEIFSYLSGGAIKGIGPATAALIVNRFGADSLRILESSPERLAEISGISMKKAIAWSEYYREKNYLRRLIDYTCSYGLRPIIAVRLFRQYGTQAIFELEKNPYIITSGSIGGTFREADTMALEEGFEPESPCRIRAAVLLELRHNLSNGHCFVPKEKLADSVSRLISVEVELAEKEIEALCEAGETVVETVGKTEACYLKELYEAECGASEILAGMRDRIGIITGGPGTGKTTSIINILKKAESNGLKVLLTAPTGRAAKRITEVTGREASTVHRLLGAKYSEDGEKTCFTVNEENKLDCDILILDECSMVDIILMHALLKALPEGARLILSGDCDQLPPVGPGKVFRSMIDSGVFPTKVLTENHRQSDGSFIIKNAHMINRGEHPDFSENSGDFFRLKRLESLGAADTIVELCSERLPKKLNLKIEEIQVLTPSRKGELGMLNLNRRLQQALNPPSKEKKEIAFGEKIFREGDRVMQIKNDYDLLWHTEDGEEAGSGIFNGDLGYILSVDRENECLEISFDGRLTLYGFSSLNRLDHAWAMTVHKAQGCEFKAVVFALSDFSKLLLTRDLLYTAVTRARELLVMVGDDRIADNMIDNLKKANRYSFMKRRIKESCGSE